MEPEPWERLLVWAGITCLCIGFWLLLAAHIKGLING